MKKNTLLFVCCLVSLFAAIASAQGGAGAPFGPGANPPPPPPGAPGFFPPAPIEGTQFQYGFTGPARTVTVEQAKTLSHHSPVIVTGTIVQAIGGDAYLFRDSSGEITLKIGPREWYALGSNIGPSDTIEISGEIHWPHHNWNVPELHARYIRKK